MNIKLIKICKFSQNLLYSYLFFSASFLNEIQSCTGIRLIAKDNSVVYARTLDFGVNLDSKILYIPHNYKFTGSTSFTYNKKALPGLKWKSKYAAVGVSALGLDNFVDGINEKGLAGGIFYLPGYTQYQDVQAEQANKSLGSWQLLTLILTRCSNVEEVKSMLSKIQVSNVQLARWGQELPIHFIIHDRLKNSVVIEFVKGKLKLHDNSLLGVLTNAPTFDWHITNLRNYVNLTALKVPKIKISNKTISGLGYGAGMHGLPGDFTSPSRFVRAAFFSQSVKQSTNSNENINSAFRILNLFNIPVGIVPEPGNKFDHTQWTSVCDLNNCNYYFHTYYNRQIYKVDLKKIMQGKYKNKATSIKMIRKQEIVDITP